jgi:hypothetical protein
VEERGASCGHRQWYISGRPGKGPVQQRIDEAEEESWGRNWESWSDRLEEPM